MLYTRRYFDLERLILNRVERSVDGAGKRFLGLHLTDVPLKFQHPEFVFGLLELFASIRHRCVHSLRGKLSRWSGPLAESTVYVGVKRINFG